MKLMVERESDSEKKRVRGREKQRQLGRGNDEYLEEKTPVEIIGERRQRLRMSRRAGGKRKQLRFELKDGEARVNLTRNAPDQKS